MPSGTSNRRREMARLFKGHEDALDRTVEIADACSFSLDELHYEYPDEPVPHAIKIDRFGAVTSVPGFATWSWPTKVTLELSAATETAHRREQQRCRSDHAFHVRSLPLCAILLGSNRCAARAGHRAVAQIVPETIQQSRRMHTVERSQCALPRLSRTIAAHVDLPRPRTGPWRCSAASTPAEFMRRHWQKRPLLIRGAVAGPFPLLSRERVCSRSRAQADVESRLVSRTERGAMDARARPVSSRLAALARRGRAGRCSCKASTCTRKARASCSTSSGSCPTRVSTT